MANPYSVNVPNVFEMLLAGDKGYDSGRQFSQDQALRAAAPDLASGNYQGALAKLLAGGNLQGGLAVAGLNNQNRQFGLQERQVNNTIQQQSPEGIAARVTAELLAKKPFESRFQNIKTPGGDEVTVHQGPAGLTVPQVQGMPAAGGSEGVPPAIAALGGKAVAAWKENRVKQLGNIDDKAILEADKAVQAGGSVIASLDRALELNKTAFHGPLADKRGYYAALTGKGAGADTLELKNVVTSQALEQLKIVFGGMPTEGERKILLEVAGSVDQPQEVRDRIFKTAKTMAAQKIEFNRRNAEQMRGGTYLLPDAQRNAQTAQPPQAGPVRISTPQEHASLPPGTPYIAPDGSLRTKQ